MTNIIAESELLLNKDGSVYHLNLLPEDISDTIITVGDQNRVAEISRYFDRIETQKSHREFVTHTGYFNNKRITVISTGIGTDNIDIVLNELDALTNIDLKTRTIKEKQHQKSLNIIRIGTCGGVQHFLDIDSFVVSEGAFGLDNLLHHYEIQEDYINEEGDMIYDSWEENFELSDYFDEHIGSLFVSSYFVEGNAALIEKFKAQNNFHSGFTVTCSGFYAPQGRKLRLQPAIDNFVEKLSSFNYNNKRILNFEMETAGIYALGRLLNHRCCSVSVVVADRVKQKFSSNAAASMNKLIENVLEAVSK